MSKVEVLEKIPVSLPELKSELTAIEKRDSELGFRAGKTKEYVNAFADLSKTAFSDLKKQLDALQIPRLKEDHIVKILDVRPKSVDELNVVLQGYTLTVSKENMKSIIDVLNK
ncbi:hypothetical protein COV13_01785 [Candidatus Woesearchaeota archaeon CG10_big_fil_rev_8_21_14_0_10_32_9]|nr:MAG: hypothetical protein COV13_01785 [Candidatus Woesearchaeota archaeon CG10_big_fil_rev_8_21_14_0_10_32_9]